MRRMRLILRKELTETVVAAIRMKAVTRPKIATPSGRKQSEDREFNPTCLPALQHGDHVLKAMAKAEEKEKKKGNLIPQHSSS